jgi:hypothetical protein
VHKPLAEKHPADKLEVDDNIAKAQAPKLLINIDASRNLGNDKVAIITTMPSIDQTSSPAKSDVSTPETTIEVGPPPSGVKNPSQTSPSHNEKKNQVPPLVMPPEGDCGEGTLTWSPGPDLPPPVSPRLSKGSIIGLPGPITFEVSKNVVGKTSMKAENGVDDEVKKEGHLQSRAGSSASGCSGSARPKSPRVWVESSFVGAMPVQSPETPVGDVTSFVFATPETLAELDSDDVCDGPGDKLAAGDVDGAIVPRVINGDNEYGNKDEGDPAQSSGDQTRILETKVPQQRSKNGE